MVCVRRRERELNIVTHKSGDTMPRRATPLLACTLAHSTATLQLGMPPFTSPTVPLQLTLLVLMVRRSNGRRVYAAKGFAVCLHLPPFQCF